MFASKRKRKEALENILYTVPSVILVSLMLYIPFIMSGYYSLTEWNGIAKEPTFIGLQNFKTIFSESMEFRKALIFTGKYTLVFVILSNVIAIALAVALTKKFRLVNVVRGVFFIPYIMSMTIVGFIWKFIFTQGFSRLFEMTDWGVWNYSWLGDPKLAFYSVALVGVWQSLGFYIVLYIAGLQAVPKDVLEAATVDGASGRKRFFHVTLPLLGPSITTCIFMSLTNALKVFDIILALTKGGPGGATYSVALQIYKEAFQSNHYGLGSAESIIYFLFVLIITQVVLKIFSSREVES
ncbi:raffinose/stachyose/melibiose transport system permease protein [Anaerocolumna jejuensis DSM 15929]|uniref:Raffinose/stachyose/melibiose transport system permease protein n=1 Tax=Anaerocolumna jejuensis DSM 15929 TaxID=1121322 RepID=A0A1M7D8C5_9FIRM|nr:sugar ABC transporter permease [Anaerocolumna jejuensis]SHL75762.1 raffinose/stachyose/melibiose transport system permease protein [Anaerocolumna jejuensis DSM 15929]